MRNLLRRGAKLQVTDALRLVVIGTLFTLLALVREIAAIHVLFYLLSLVIALSLPALLTSGFAQRKSNLNSPYERAVRRLKLSSPLADTLFLAGFALLFINPHSLVWWITAITVTYCAIYAVLVTNFLSKKRRYSQWLAAFLAKYGPEFALTTPRPDGGSYQIQMWLSPAETLGRKFLILVRDPRALDALEKLTTHPVIVAHSWGELDQVMESGIRVVFYVNSVGANADLLTYRTARHVYLGHGDSEKPLSVHPLHASFDHIAVAGQAAIDRYAEAGIEIPAHKFLRIGRPQLATASTLKSTPKQTEHPTVLYAPTWGGYNAQSQYSSLTFGAEIVNKLIANGLRVIFRPHPFSLQRASERAKCQEICQILEKDNSQNSAKHQFGKGIDDLSFIDTMWSSDALIADRSSVIIDYLGTMKPIAEIEFGDKALRTGIAAQTPYAYPVERSLNNLSTTLEAMFSKDPLRDSRERAAQYYLGGANDSSAKFRTVISELFV